MDENFLIWLAGFFDGEGYICKKHYNTCLAQKGRKAVSLFRKLQRSFGGYLRKDKRTNVWSWELLNRRDINQFLTALLPFLIVKKAAAAAMLARIKRSYERFPKPHFNLKTDSTTLDYQCSLFRQAQLQFDIWAAGFYDAEGYYNQANETVVISQSSDTGKLALRRLKEKYGGWLYSNPKKPAVTEWRLKGRRKVLKFFNSILPWLVLKGNKVTKLLEELNKKPACRNPLSTEERKFIEQSFQFLSSREIAEILGRGKTTILRYAKKVGLKNPRC